MTVECPSCHTSFPVDPKKVPQGGVHARCSVCEAVFFVAEPARQEAPSTPPYEASFSAASANEPGSTVMPEVGAPGEEPSTAREEAPLAAQVPGDSQGAEDSQAPAAAPAAEPDGVVQDEPFVEAEPPFEPEGPVAAEVSVTMDEVPPATLADADEEDGSEDAFPEDLGQPSAGPFDEATTPWQDPPTSGEPEPLESESESTGEESPWGPPDLTPHVEVDAEEGERAAPVFGRRDPREKAQRLARVLVSDIILYNPDRHQMALEDGNLAAEFEEEIQKSWDEYVEQVGQEIANESTYFQDALNEILAKGERVF